MHILRTWALKFFALAVGVSFFVAPEASLGTLAIVTGSTESILPRAHLHAMPSMGGPTVPFHVVLRVPCFSSITALVPSFLPLSRAFFPAHRPCVSRTRGRCMCFAISSMASWPLPSLVHLVLFDRCVRFSLGFDPDVSWVRIPNSKEEGAF